MKIKLKLKIKKGNPVAKDLRTPKYKLRVVLSKKLYKRIKRVQHECQ